LVKYPEVEKRRIMLTALKKRIDGSNEPVLGLEREDIVALGREVGLSDVESVRMFKRLVEGYFIRVSVGQDGPYIELGGYLLVQVEDLTDYGLQEIGVLPRPADSFEGVVATLEELAQRIEADPTEDEESKDRKAGAVRSLVREFKQAAISVGAKELVEQLARVFAA